MKLKKNIPMKKLIEASKSADREIKEWTKFKNKVQDRIEDELHKDN